MRTPAPPRDIPPPLELECLKALWEIGEGSVKQVRAVLAERRGLAYTTVMTVLDRLVRRGSAERRKVGRYYVYKSLRGPDELRRLAVAELADSLFDGSREKLLAFLKEEKSPPQKPEPEPAIPVMNEHLDTELL